MKKNKNGYDTEEPVRKQLKEFILIFRLNKEKDQEGDFDWNHYCKVLQTYLHVSMMKVYKTKEKPPNYHFVINQTTRLKEIKVEVLNESLVHSPKYLITRIGVKTTCRPYYRGIKEMKFLYEKNPDYELLKVVGDYNTLAPPKDISERERVLYYHTLPTPQAKKDYITSNELEGIAYLLDLNDAVLTNLDNQIKQANLKSNLDDKVEKINISQDSIKNISTHLEQNYKVDKQSFKPSISFDENLIKAFLKKAVADFPQFVASHKEALEVNVPHFFNPVNEEYTKYFLEDYFQKTHKIALKDLKTLKKTPKLDPFFNFTLVYYGYKSGSFSSGQWYKLIKELYGVIIPNFVKDKIDPHNQY